MSYFVAPDRVETTEYVLRTYEPGDGPLLHEAVISSYEHLKTFMAWANPDQTPEESEKLCREFRGKYLLAQEFTMGIFNPAGDRLLGGTGFHFDFYAPQTLTAEIGMWISQEQAGKGLGTKVLKTLIKWSFEKWPWQKVIWRCASTNFASAAVARKSGLLQEGYLRGDVFAVNSKERRDTILFGLTREDWLGAKQG